MLTRTQIQRYAQRSGIGAQAQERDYLQHLLLFLLYRRSQALVFKGGTALRVAYHGNRYSEDLDFNSPPDLAVLQQTWQGVVEDLALFGVIAQMQNAWQSEVGYSFDVSCQGPLYDGRDRTKGKVRVDANLRQEAVESRRELVHAQYDDLPPFVVNVISPEHLLAEKVRALVMRAAPRDAYDVWLLTQQGIALDVELVAQKLALYQVKLTQDNLSQALAKAGKDWARDLQPLLPQFIAWDDVAPVLKRKLAIIIL